MSRATLGPVSSRKDGGHTPVEGVHEPLLPGEAPPDLFGQAHQASLQAYCPYSGFHVGAAIRLASGLVVSGCNVESASYPVGTCAERNAVGAALLQAKPGDVLEEMALVAWQDDGPAPCSPCGACRQVLAEQNPEMAIHFRYYEPLSVVHLSARELLPYAFDLD